MRDPEFFASLDHNIRTLLRDLTQGWTEDEIAAVRVDVGYGEWKLAIEQLAGGIVRLNKPLTPELLAKIDDLAPHRINMTKNRYLRALHSRANRLGIKRERTALQTDRSVTRTASG
jgi:hypothetical protein